MTKPAPLDPSPRPPTPTPTPTPAEVRGDARALLRHALATLAYRGAKPLRDAPAAFAEFEVGGDRSTTRNPVRILAHIGDLMDWALTQARGEERWHDSTPLPWDREVARFFAAVARFDAYLASDAPLAVTPERLFQGPVADALTHVGQLAMLRRLSGAPIRGENYAKAEIVAGRTGPDQIKPRREFD